MTKKDLIDYFKALLPRIDKTGKYHSKVIAHAIERAVNNVLCDLYMKSPELIDPYMKEYLGSDYDEYTGIYLLTLEDSDTGLWYADLPVSYVPIPVVGSGVREVALLDDDELTFVPSRYDDIMRSQDFDMNYLTSMVSYATVGSKLIFSTLPDGYDGEELRVRLITSFTDYDDDDDFIIPYGQDMTIMQNVYQILGLIPPVDLYVNNSDYGRGKRQDNG